MPDPPHDPLGPEMLQDDGPGVLRVHLGEQVRRPLARHDLHERRLMAHAHAAHPLHHGRRAGLGQHGPDRLVHLAAALRDATGAQADADLAHLAGRWRRPGWAFRWAVLGLVEEIGEHLGDLGGREPAVGHLVDLDHRRQGAAAQARDLLDGEQAVAVRVFSIGETQVSLQRVLDQAGPLHVARRPVAHADHVLSHGPVPELRVERRYPGDVRRRDLGQLANPLERLLGQVAVVRLDRLEDGDHGLAPAAPILDRPVNEAQIEVAL